MRDASYAREPSGRKRLSAANEGKTSRPMNRPSEGVRSIARRATTLSTLRTPAEMPLALELDRDFRSCRNLHILLPTLPGRCSMLPRGAGTAGCAVRSCTRVFLPPEPERLPRRGRDGAASSPLTGLSLATWLRWHRHGRARGRLPGRMAHTSVARVVFTTGFVLCLFLSLIFFLDFSPGRLAIFGVMTIGFFLLLLRTPRKRSAAGGLELKTPCTDQSEMIQSDLASIDRASSVHRNRCLGEVIL